MIDWTDAAGWRLDALLPAATGYVPSIVAGALDRNWADQSQARRMPTGADAEHAVRAERLAVLADRAARWWRVLGAWVYSRASGSMPLVFGAAALRAADDCRDGAGFWRETAADWRARAEYRPTSDAAGALCNHYGLADHQLAVVIRAGTAIPAVVARS